MVSKKGGVVVWVLLFIIIVLLFVVVLYFLDDKESGDKKIVRDAIYEVYMPVCNDVNEDSVGECKGAAACVADGIVKRLSDESVGKFKVSLDNYGIERALEDMVVELGEDNVALINEEISPCMKKIGDIVTEKMHSSLDRGTACLDAISQIFIEDDELTCFDSDGDYVNVHVRRGAKDFVLSGIQIFIFEAGVADSTIVTTNLPGVDADSVIRIEVSGRTPDKVEMAPIVFIGDAEEVCAVSSSLSLKAC